MSDRIVMDGSGELDLRIDGTCVLSNVADGQSTVVVKISDTPVYSGPMEFTASQEAQIISTFGKMMPDDIIIAPVPNNYGLITWNGSTLTVS